MASLKIITPERVPTKGLEPKGGTAILPQVLSGGGLRERQPGEPPVPGQFDARDFALRHGITAAAFDRQNMQPANDGSVSILGQAMSSPPPVPQAGAVLSSAIGQPAAAPVAPPPSAKRPSFFDKGGVGQKVLRGLSDFALYYGASTGDQGSILTLRNRADQAARKTANAREDQLRLQDRQWKVEDLAAQRNAPQYFNSGHDRVRLDPQTGQSQVVYDGPEDYQTYAGTLGYDPGEDGYEDAVQDYVLRGNGPAAQAARRALEATRASQRLLLRATPTYAQAHPAARRSGGGGGSGAPKSTSAVVAPILLKMAKGQPLTAGEQQALAYGRGGPGGGGSFPVVRTPADAAKLPSGTRFKTPDGRTKVVP